MGAKTARERLKRTTVTVSRFRPGSPPTASAPQRQTRTFSTLSVLPVLTVIRAFDAAGNGKTNMPCRVAIDVAGGSGSAVSLTPQSVAMRSRMNFARMIALGSVTERVRRNNFSSRVPGTTPRLPGV